MTPEEGTIVALATPPGRSALGIVRISGPRCRELARVLLGTELEPRRATPRPLRRNGAVVDRVVATYWAGPSTPTGEDLLELTGHGSPELLREIVEAALEAGARPAAPGEFPRRAYVNGRLDLAQARAVGDLISARGSAARAAALARLSGGLSDALDAARAPRAPGGRGRAPAGPASGWPPGGPAGAPAARARGSACSAPPTPARRPCSTRCSAGSARSRLPSPGPRATCSRSRPSWGECRWS